MKYAFILLVVIGFCSCKRGERIEKQTSDKKYTIEVQPFNPNNNVEDSLIAYNIRITAHHLKGLMNDTLGIQTIEKRKYYFSYHFGKDITLVVNNQRYTPNSFHYESGTDIRGYHNFFIFFKVPIGVVSNGKKQLIVHSPILTKENVDFELLD